jgi:hypothetical protein
MEAVRAEHERAVLLRGEGALAPAQVERLRELDRVLDRAREAGVHPAELLNRHGDRLARRVASTAVLESRRAAELAAQRSPAIEAAPAETGIAQPAAVTGIET